MNSRFTLLRENVVTLDTLFAEQSPVPGHPRRQWLDLWLFPLDLQPDVQARLALILPEAESARAELRLRPVDRERIKTAHALLRLILARYVDQDPRTLCIAPQDTGKPSLPDYPSIHFNLSHSAAWAGIAVADGLVGVDIEKMTPRKHIPLIAERFSLDIGASACPDAGRENFYANWTYKEAAAKVYGEGMKGIQQAKTPWSHIFSPNSGYLGTLAASFSPMSLCIYRLEG